MDVSEKLVFVASPSITSLYLFYSVADGIAVLWLVSTFGTPFFGWSESEERSRHLEMLQKYIPNQFTWDHRATRYV